MQAIIYGKNGCVECEKAKMLCQMKGISFSHKVLGVDLVLEDLLHKVPMNAPRSLPQIFFKEEDGTETYIGGYNALRTRSYQSQSVH